MKVISFGVWGTNPLYTTGIVDNCNIIQKLYLDWEPWVYYNNTLPAQIVDELHNMNVKLIHINNDNTNGLNSVWRFQPSMNESVDVFLSRDCDSRITQREMQLVNMWLNSDKELHIIRDHAWHQMPIMAGMFGIKRGNLMNILQQHIQNHLLGNLLVNDTDLEHLHNTSMYQYDEKFLECKIFPSSINCRMSHVSAGALYADDIIIQPPHGNDFIGNKIHEITKTPIIQYVNGLTRK